MPLPHFSISSEYHEKKKELPNFANYLRDLNIMEIIKTDIDPIFLKKGYPCNIDSILYEFNEKLKNIKTDNIKIYENWNDDKIRNKIKNKLNKIINKNNYLMCSYKMMCFLNNENDKHIIRKPHSHPFNYIINDHLNSDIIIGNFFNGEEDFPIRYIFKEDLSASKLMFLPNINEYNYHRIITNIEDIDPFIEDDYNIFEIEDKIDNWETIKFDNSSTKKLNYYLYNKINEKKPDSIITSLNLYNNIKDIDILCKKNEVITSTKPYKIGNISNINTYIDPLKNDNENKIYFYLNGNIIFTIFCKMNK